MKTLTLILTLIATTCYGQDSTDIKLLKYKGMYEQGLIDSAEYKMLRGKLLGVEQKQSAPTTIIVQQSPVDTMGMVEANQWLRKGESDAAKYFKTGGVFGGTFVCTMFTGPVIGLIPAIACSSSKPPYERLINAGDNTLFNNQYYMKGYMGQARKMKRGNAWTAWGTGFLIHAVASITTGLVLKGKRK